MIDTESSDTESSDIRYSNGTGYAADMVAAFEAVGTGRLLVTATGDEYVFRIGGRTRSVARR